MKAFKRFILLGIILVLLTPIFGMGKDETEMDLMVGVLEETGASFVEKDMTFGGVILDRFLDEEELLELGNFFKDEMEIKGDLIDTEIAGYLHLGEEEYYTQNLVKDKGLNQLIIQGVDNSRNLVTINISSYEIEGYPGETSLFINLINNEQIFENNDIILKVENFFEKHDKMMNVTSCIAGSIDGEVDFDEMESKILQYIEELRGKVVEDYREEKIFSISAFTPLIEEYIYTGNEKMNLNVVLRYNDYENKTYVLIGTPIITVGY